jgi:hypothetical protein
MAQKTIYLSSQNWKRVIRLPAVSEIDGEILFGFSFRLLRERDHLTLINPSPFQLDNYK